MEENDKIPPARVPIQPEVSCTTKKGFEEYKPCDVGAFMSKFAIHLKAEAINGIIGHHEFRAALKSFGKSLENSVDIRDFAIDCEKAGIIVPNRLAGWKIETLKPIRERMW